MKNITVIFHDDAADPTPGLRESVKAIADAHGAQHVEVDGNKVTLASGDYATIEKAWVDLQAVGGIQISSNCSKDEHTALSAAIVRANEAAAPAQKKKKPAAN